MDSDTILTNIEVCCGKSDFLPIPSLFHDEQGYREFQERHQNRRAKCRRITRYDGRAYLGIDAGSTTVKAVVLGGDCELLNSIYQSSSDNPVPVIHEYLMNLYKQYPNLMICPSAMIGYGEELPKNAFNLNFGIMGTMAYFTTARYFIPDVDSIIDIGGQDLKCFKIRDGTVDNIFLNEVCSSGCGPFLQTSADTLGYGIANFARKDLSAENPVGLGSRCTVFMNSPAKQAQKDGAATEDIFAGLSVSVVKNAIYKVIRVAPAGELGKNIVAQGGTSLNDAVLRVFEKEPGVNIIRPDISGLVGALDAALYTKSRARETGTLLPCEELRDSTHEVKVATCGPHSNHCRLTISNFGGNRRFISGNRCEKPTTRQQGGSTLDTYTYKLDLLQGYQSVPGIHGEVDIPMDLNFCELLPFWHSFWTTLGFRVIPSPLSTRSLYLDGRHTIPPDAVCFPAKLMHGRIEALLRQGTDAISCPCMSYNLSEGLDDDHYNCPMVAYYPEVLSANVEELKQKVFIHDYVGTHRKRGFPTKMHQILNQYFSGASLHEVQKAAKAAYEEHDRYSAQMHKEDEYIIEEVEHLHEPIIVLSDRSYHPGPEIDHGINKLVTSLGAAVISEDVISNHVEKSRAGVLSQWAYHSRLCAAAKYIGTQPDMNPVQLVSFGHGVDATTTDEVREILEAEGRIYTQIKIDKITNLGAMKVRLYSLLTALRQ